jgi:hypothetical protein
LDALNNKKGKVVSPKKPIIPTRPDVLEEEGPPMDEETRLQRLTESC